MSGNMVNLLADLKDNEVLELVKQRLNAGEDPLKILEDSRKGIDIVGKRFADNEYFASIFSAASCFAPAAAPWWVAVPSRTAITITHVIATANRVERHVIAGYYQRRRSKSL